MFNKKSKKLTLFKPFSLILVLLAINVLGSTSAMAITADDYLNKMSIEEQVSYMAGVTDGFAQYRWIRDRPDETGSQCIHDWYLNGGKEVEKLIETWFRRHLDKPTGALLYVLIKKECGE